MTSLVFGASGQDGQFLARLLNSQDEEVVGVFNEKKRHLSDLAKLESFSRVFFLNHENEEDINKLLQLVQPDRVFNFVGFSSVSQSFLESENCFAANLIFVDRLLGAVRKSKVFEKVHLIQCSSSEMYAGTSDKVIVENSEIKPISPYGISKASAHYLAKCYRNAYNLRVSNAILFNHESELRTERFFSKKAVKGMVDLYLQKKDIIEMDNLSFERDWSYVADVVNALELVSKRNEPDDFVVSSGRLRSAVEFFEVGFAYLGMDRNLKDCLIEKNESHRPLDHQGQVGDAKKLKALTKWGPKVEFEKMISIMIDSELKERKIKN